MYFSGIQRVRFLSFPNTALDGGGEAAPQFLLEFLQMLQYKFKPYATSKMEFFVTKNGNSWELFLTGVTESFVLIVTELLDPTLKSIDKFRLRQ